MGRLIRGVAAVISVVLTLVGLPVALVVFQRAVEWDWPLIVAQPLSPGGFAAAGVGGGWLLWLLLVRLVVLDAVDAIRHVAAAPRLPVPLHTAVTAAAGAFMLAVNAVRGGTDALHLPTGTSVIAATIRTPAAGGGPQPGADATQPGPDTTSNGHGQGPLLVDASPPGPAGSAVSALDVHGVAVPGGWLPLPVLAALGTAVAAVWTQRRRAYRPRPPAGAHRADPDLAPVPVTLQRLLRWGRALPDVFDGYPEPAAADPMTPSAAVAADGTAARGALRSTTPTDAPGGPVDFADLLEPGAALVDGLPWPGVGLVGPGAHDAARGLLVALSTDSHRDAPPVTIAEGVLRTLLGPGLTAGGSPRLRVAQADPSSDTGRRRPERQGRDDAVAGGEAAAGNAPGGEPPADGVGGVVLLPGIASGTSTAVRGSAGPAGASGSLLDPEAVHDGPAGLSDGVRVIRLGAWPGTVTWVVAGGGTVHMAGGDSPAPRRVAVLGREAAGAVLTGLGLLISPAPSLPSDPSPGRTGAQDLLRSGGHRFSVVGPAVDEPRGRGEVGGPWPRTPPAVAHDPRRLQLRVLGRPAVLRPHPDGSVSEVTVRRSAGRQILLLLAVHRGPVSVDVIKEAVWPDVPGKAAHRRYLTNMSELRLVLADAAGQPVLQQATNTARPGGTRYWLDPDTVDVDLWRVHDLLDAADGTVEQPRRLRLLQEAADLCTGDLADGSTEDWLTVERERLARHALDLRVHLADLEPDHDAAVRLLRRALRDAPGNEAVHRRLLQRHAAAGDADGLRRAAATLTEHLADAGAEPEPGTAELIAAVLGNVPDRRDRPTTTAAAAVPGPAVGSSGVRSTVERSRS